MRHPHPRAQALGLSPHAASPCAAHPPGAEPPDIRARIGPAHSAPVCWVSTPTPRLFSGPSADSAPVFRSQRQLCWRAVQKTGAEWVTVRFAQGSLTVRRPPPRRRPPISARIEPAHSARDFWISTHLHPSPPQLGTYYEHLQTAIPSKPLPNRGTCANPGCQNQDDSVTPTAAATVVPRIAPRPCRVPDDWMSRALVNACAIIVRKPLT